MRRIVFFLVVALVGAGCAGYYVNADAARVNSTSVSAATVRSELSAIAASPSFACYLQSLYSMNTSNTSNSFNAVGTASWMNVRIEGLSIENYMTDQYNWVPSSQELRAAKTKYVGDLAAAASQAGNSCGVSASAALATMPATFVNDQVYATAAYLALVSHLSGIVPFTMADVKSFYNANAASYDTICFSAAIIPLADQAKFEADRHAGMSIADLAKKYSVDPSASKGGAYGCFAPSDSHYSNVRDYVNGVPTGEYSTTPKVVQSQSGQSFLIYVAPTKRTPTPFDKALTQVVIDVRAHNTALGSQAQRELLMRATVVVDPTFARWAQAKLTAIPLKLPPPASVPNAGVGLGF